MSSKKLLYIGNKLSKHGYTPTSIETLGTFFSNEGFQVDFASSQKNKALRFLDMLWKTFQLRNKADYVIIDTYSTINFWYAFAVSQLCRILRLKYIPILRGGDLPERLKKSPKLCALIFNNAYKNVAPSKYLMHYFELAEIQNLIYIPNTIELKNYPFKLRENIAPKLLWVRSFAKIYNPKMAVDVFHAIKKEYPEATLCMVGPEKDGSLEETKNYAQQLDLQVQFTGRLSKEEWIGLSENYDIFLNTTHFDNTPVSVIEAMALGLPVITTNVGGIPFLLEDAVTGILVNDKDQEKMIEAVKLVLNNSHYAKSLSQNARLLASAFDWQEVKSTWSKILS